MSRKTTVYHFRGHKIKSVSEIPNEPHWAVLLDRVQDINAVISREVSEFIPEEKLPDINISLEPPKVEFLDYYVFRDNEKDKMRSLVDLFYNENPSREDVKIVRTEAIQHKVKFVVDLNFPEENFMKKDSVESTDSEESDAENIPNG